MEFPAMLRCSVNTKPESRMDRGSNPYKAHILVMCNGTCCPPI